MEEGDLIRIDVPGRVLEIVGTAGEARTPAQMEEILRKRRAAWKPKAAKYPTGVLRTFSQHAVSPMRGGYME